MARKEHEYVRPDKALGLETFRQPADEGGLSLEELNAAFAQMLGAGDVPYAEQPADVAVPADESSALFTEPGDESDGVELSPRTILEAILFVGSPTNQPLASQQIAGLMRGVRPAEIDALVRELNRDYADRRCPYRIESQAAGYRLVLTSELAGIRERFQAKARQAKLSQAAIEVLSAVAYNQPLSSDEVSKLRGTPSGHVLSQLVRRELLRLERTAGRPARTQFWTTERFLELFSLASLDDLPRGQDVEAP